MAFQARRASLKQNPPASGTTIVLAPTEGTITLAGQVASLTLILAAVAGSVVIGGNAPALTEQIAGVSGSVVISGNAPSVSQAVILAPTEGAVTISGNAPALSKTLSPTEGSVVIGGQTPAISLALQATEGSIVISGNAPSFPGNITVAPSEGSVVIDGNAPSLLNISQATDQPSGGYWPDYVGYKRRKHYGIPEQVDAIIEAVAAHQTQELSLSAQERLAELEQELEAQGIEYQTRYLELLNIERQERIDAEIKRYFDAEQALDAENAKRLLLLMAVLA